MSQFCVYLEETIKRCVGYKISAIRSALPFPDTNFYVYTEATGGHFDAEADVIEWMLLLVAMTKGCGVGTYHISSRRRIPKVNSHMERAIRDKTDGIQTFYLDDKGIREHNRSVGDFLLD